MRWALPALVLGAISCSTPGGPASEPVASRSVSAAKSSASADTVTTAARKLEVAPEEDKGPDLSGYQKALLTQLKRRSRMRPVGNWTSTSTQAPAHKVVALKKIGREKSMMVLTAGLGLGQQVSSKVRIELWADTEAAGPGVAEVLTQLGTYIFSHGSQGGQSYQTIALEQPIHGLQYFDLRPGGEVDLASGLRVQLLKVVPLSADEFDKAQSDTGSQWLTGDAADPGAATKIRQRWKPATQAKPGA